MKKRFVTVASNVSANHGQITQKEKIKKDALFSNLEIEELLLIIHLNKTTLKECAKKETLMF
jgi:hypothetical protein